MTKAKENALAAVRRLGAALLDLHAAHEAWVEAGGLRTDPHCTRTQVESLAVMRAEYAVKSAAKRLVRQK